MNMTEAVFDPGAPVRVDIMGDGFLEVLRARDVSVGGLGIKVSRDFAGYGSARSSRRC